MAGACNIIRDENANIAFVEAPNGSRSILYDQLREKTKDAQEALKLWLTSKTKKFKEVAIGPKLNKHRSTLLNELTTIKVKGKVLRVEVEGKPVDLDIENIEFTNLTAEVGPKALSTLSAYARPVGGGAAVRIGRIRYRTRGNDIEIDSSSLTNFNPLEKSIAVFRGEGNNFRQAPNEGILWVSTNEEIAKDYAGTLEDGSLNVRSLNIIEPKAAFKLPYKNPNTYITSEDMANQFRKALRERARSKDISVKQARELSAKITNYTEIAGDNLERAHTKITKPEVTKVVSEILAGIGFDAIEIVEEGVSTYGLFKEQAPAGKLQGRGIGGRMYGELFKYALKNEMNVISSDSNTLSPASTALWNKLTNLGLARKLEDRYMLNSYPVDFDVNGEPVMSTVLDFVDRQGYKEEITEDEQAEIYEIMVGLPVNSSKELLESLKRGFMKKGYFSPTREDLMRTGLYTREEITDILTDADLQEQIREFIYKLEGLEAELLNDIYQDDTYLVVKDGSKNVIGNFKLENPYITEKKVIEKLGGLPTREDFEEALYTDDIQEAIASPYESSKNTKEDLYHKLSVFKPAAELTIEEDQITTKTSNVRELLEQTLTEPESTKLEDDLDFLISLDESVWLEANDAVIKLINNAVDQMANIGLDASELLTKARGKSIEEIKDFLTSVRNFAIEANERTFDALVSEYKEYFDIDDSFKFKKVQLPNKMLPKNIFYLEANLTGPEVFSKYNLIPIAKNTYKRVEPLDVEQLLNILYDNSIKSNGYENILPDEALGDVVKDSDGTINLSKVLDPKNKEAIISSMRSYVEAQVKNLYVERLPIDTEVLQKYVIMFNYFNKSTDYSKFDTKPGMGQEYEVMVNPINNAEYLTTDFIADFNKRSLKEKIKKSRLYSDFFSNFAIDRQGIHLINEDPLTRNKLKPYLEQNKDLVDYFRLHKDRSPLLSETIEDPIRDDLFLRNYYSNYPTSIKPFKGEYSSLSENTLAVKSKAPFIRTPQGVFEYIEGIGRIGVYARLDTNDGMYKSYNLGLAPPQVDANMDTLRNIDANIQDVTKIKHLYDAKEKQEIDNKYDNC